MTLLLGGCWGSGRKKVMDASVGRPFEVVLSVDDSSCASFIDSLLGQPVVALPQEEPSFDVRVATDAEYEKLSRCRVVIKTSVDSLKFSKVDITYVTDRYAYPQLLVSINAPSYESIKSIGGGLSTSLVKVLADFEAQCYGRILGKNGNPTFAKKVMELFGVEMAIPQDLTVSLAGKNFLWMSSNTERALKNICLYTLPMHDLSLNELLALRDSVEGVNIKGQTASQRMVTDVENAVFSKAIIHGDTVLQVRTLWHMEKDIMAGPLYLTAHFDRKHGRVLVAEAFLYAPEQKKRNIMHQLETAVNTLKIN